MIFWKFLPRCHFGSVPETLQKMTSAELVVRVTELSGKEFQVGIWIGWWRRKEWTRHEDKLGDLGKLRLLGFAVTNATLTLRVFFLDARWHWIAMRRYLPCGRRCEHVGTMREDKGESIVGSDHSKLRVRKGKVRSEWLHTVHPLWHRGWIW